MFRTFIGFNTLVYRSRLKSTEADELLTCFERYEATGKIRVLQIYESSKKKVLKIDYLSDNEKGITWVLKSYSYQKDLKDVWLHFIEAKINPKILAGTPNSTSTEDYIKILEKSFGENAKEFSEIPSFHCLANYNLIEIDYCIDFDLRKLGIECSPELLIELIRQSNPPPYYGEWVHCDEISHKEIGSDYGLCLKCKSVDINCYWEQWQSKGRPDSEAPINVIRFEVQCKYPKVYYLSRNILGKMLSDNVSGYIIDGYFKRVIMAGDYYTLSDARTLIRNHDFKEKKERRLIDVLELINDHRGVTKARDYISNRGGDMSLFSRSLRELSASGVNPVTIPKNYGVKYIPNLLDTFYQLSSFERSANVTLRKSLKLRDWKDRDEVCEEEPVDLDEDI